MNKKLFAQSASKWLILPLFVVIFSLLITQQVAAGTSKKTKYGFLSGVTAYAKISANQGQSASGSCEIRSYTSPATTINVIGWTWWQCDLLQNGNIVDSAQFGPRALTASSTQQGIIYPYAFWYGNSLKAQGTHDFNHTGSNPSPWRPYNTKTYP